MLVKIQLLRDDGSVIMHCVIDALTPGGWETFPGDGPIIEGGQKLYGFTYLPLPPLRDSTDMAEFRRLVAEHFGSAPLPASP